jgi:hypothetical protein
MPAFWKKLHWFRQRVNKPSGASPSTAPGRNRRWCWISSIGGAAVILGAYYFWYTSARLLTEPIRIDYGPTHASFANAIGPMTGADFTEGNQIKTLINGDEFSPRCCGRSAKPRRRSRSRRISGPPARSATSSSRR